MALQVVKKHACGGFFDEFCTVCLGAFGSPGGKQESLATQGFRNRRRPKPDRRLGLGLRRFRFGNQRAAALQYLQGFRQSEGLLQSNICTALFSLFDYGLGRFIPA